MYHQKQINDLIMKTKFYQPISKKNNELPSELYSWQVFLTKRNAIRWLMMKQYNIDDFDIKEYDEDDIEDYSVADIFGYSNLR